MFTKSCGNSEIRHGVTHLTVFKIFRILNIHRNKLHKLKFRLQCHSVQIPLLLESEYQVKDLGFVMMHL